MEDRISIINHSVKITDIGLLQFLYPDYIVLDGPVLYSDRPIIYIGETKYLNQIKSLGVNYISLSAVAEYDLTDRLTLLKVVFSKYNRPVPKYLLEFYEDLDEGLFRELVERYWITGKWSLKEFNNSGAFLEFLQSFKTDTVTMVRTYLNLLHKTGAEYIRVSLLTFLTKVLNPSSKISKWYKQVIDNYKKSKADLIEPAINNFIDSPIDNEELKILNFILDLNRKTY